MVSKYILKFSEGSPLPQILLALTVSLCSLTNGFLFAWTSPFIPKFTASDSYIPMTLEEASYFVILPPISSIISSPIFSYLVNKIGRKFTMLLLPIPHVISWVITIFSNSIMELYIARIVAGVGDGGLFIIVPMYIGEAMEPKIRGTWGNGLAVSIYFGQFLINVIGSVLDVRETALVCVFIPVIFFILFSFAPETPYYLLMKGRTDDARSALKTLRSRDDVEEELKKLTHDVQRQMSESGTIKDFFTIDSNRKAFLVCLGLRITQQFAGVQAFTAYTQYMFGQAGGDLSKTTASNIYMGFLTFMNFSASFITDKFGRRVLTIFSCIGSCIVLAIEAVYFYLSDYTSTDTSSFNWLPLGGMLAYLVVFSVGLGVMPTLMLGELFSASIKGVALCVMNMCFGILVITVPKLFQVLTANFGLFAPFCMFAICTFIGIFFSYYFLPETKGKTLEEIQMDFKGKQDKSNDRKCSSQSVEMC